MESEWTAFERTYLLYNGIKYIDVRTDARLYKLIGTDEIYVNNIYQVYVYRGIIKEGWPELIWLSIKRRDKEPIHDWRHLQRIKNEVIGLENEAIELYPAESRLVDTANQYHLWVLADKEIRFPFGWNKREVSEAPFNGGKQRPF
jgi:hypothetical protein